MRRLSFCLCPIRSMSVSMAKRWGSSGWGDPAWDFAGVPLRAVPLLLQGYRTAAALDGEATAEARILWRHLQLALLVLRRGPLPGRSWAERPLAMLLEIMRFMIE